LNQTPFKERKTCSVHGSKYTEGLADRLQVLNSP